MRASGPGELSLEVDDNGVAIARQLSGMDLTIAHSGRAAVERIFRGEPVDLVLRDVMMPGGSGQDVYDAVARRRSGVAAEAGVRHRLRHRARGGDVPASRGARHLAKPFEREAFQRMLADIQAARPTAPALPVALDVRTSAG